LENLQSAVDSAGTALGQAVGRLESARTAAAAFERLETGLDSSGRVSNAIDQAGTTMRTEVQAARRGLTGLTGQLDRNQSEVSKTTQQSIDLANAVRAGLNPTPPSAERVSNGAAEQDLRLRGTEHSQSTDRDR
jgi:hypothetical protein